MALFSFGKKKAAEPASDPTKREETKAPIAPWPLIDKYPNVLGSNLTVSYISAVMRNATTGYRKEYVDVLSELIERDPSAFAVVAQRVMQVAGGRVEVDTPEGVDESRRERADELAEEVKLVLRRIVGFRECLSTLMWGVYYGVSACEIGWDNSSGVWAPTQLYFLHPRRLNYPDPNSWDLHIWDQGPVRSWWIQQTDQTADVWGMPAREYPGKFIVHTPQVRGEYPTRDGLGRDLVFWMGMKLATARGAEQFIERYAKPWTVAYYKTSDEEHANARAAQEEDIQKADMALRALGTGGLNAATLPDAIKIDQVSPEIKGKGAMSHIDWMTFCDEQIAKCVLGQSLTTSTSGGGSRARDEVAKRGTLELARYDAMRLAATLQRDLIDWYVKLNYPNDTDVTPVIHLIVDEEPSPDQVISVAERAVKIGMPIDADALAARLGLQLVDPTDTKARRLAPAALTPVFELDPKEVKDERAEEAEPQAQERTPVQPQPQKTQDEEPTEEENPKEAELWLALS